VFCEEVTVMIKYNETGKMAEITKIEGSIHVFRRNTVVVKVLAPDGKPLQNISVKVGLHPGYTGGGVSFSNNDVLNGVTDSRGLTTLYLTPDKGGVIVLYVNEVRAKQPIWIEYPYLPIETSLFIAITAIALLIPLIYLGYKLLGK
jgi:hypothetical protein